MKRQRPKSLRRKTVLLLSCLLLLSGCAPGEAGTPVPTPRQTQPADTPSPEVSPSAVPVTQRRPDVTGEWHRTGCHSEASATVTISAQTAEGFTVEADCYYGAHSGHLPETTARFTGETAGVMEVYGDYEYRSETGPQPPVEFTWDGDTMTITTEARDLDLGFGVNVYIHGTYTRGKPEYTNAGQLDRLLSPEEQERLRAVAGENYDYVALVLGNGTVETDVPCLLADGRRARYISAVHSPNWGESIEIILAEDGRTYYEWNEVQFCTDDPDAAELPEVVWPLNDDTHDFFTVPTGGRLGTVVVTVELGEKSDPDVFGPSPLTLSVWSPDDLTAPIQVIQSETDGVFHHSRVVDANFDGHMDFGYMYAMGNQPCYSHYWIWNEEQGQFVAEPEFDQISCPVFDPETGIIDGWARSSAASDGLATFHRWEDGKLVCVRRVTSKANGVATLLVEDREDGELKEVFYREYPWEEIAGEIEGMEAWWEDRMKWEDLSYHGET